ncbi:hypothetical protein F4776DRAFT_175375 [Hypoxylon sp. NC0597]|nr:hypothetical protein F4776DRAFT_175375 [Hypoxylon sp. NC0597]
MPNGSIFITVLLGFSLTWRTDINSQVSCAARHFWSEETNWMHPFLIKAKPGFLEWCKGPTSARAYRREDDNLLDIIPVDAFRGGPWGFSNATMGMMIINTFNSEMFLPIHGPCIHLARLFCHYQSRFNFDFRDITDDGGVPSSIAHLYEIWMKRALLMNPGHLGPLHSPIDEPNGYHGAVFFKNLRQYADWVDKNRKPLQEVNPSGNFTLTRKFLQDNITSTEGKDMTPKAEYLQLASRISKLPNEIAGQIEDALEPFDDLGPAELTCNRMLSPSWWKSKLYSGDLIPWLFDLPEVFDVEDRMDWELLCRQLGQRDVFGPTGILNGHRHLENRHRIWRVLSSSRLGQMGPRRAGRAF